MAICGELLKQGRSVQYLMWRDQIRALKSYDGDMDERSDQLRKYKTADVLYIDDFLKCGKNEVPTKADTDVALEILMARYNQPDKLTVISTERSISELLELDEALGSRIYERSKGFCLRNTGTDKNWPGTPGGLNENDELRLLGRRGTLRRCSGKGTENASRKTGAGNRL